MSTFHQVEQGEHVTRIASAHGFGDYHSVWDHADNSDLKQLRLNPNVLNPGDRLVIPDKETKSEAAETGHRSTFRLNGNRLTLRLRLLDFFGAPIADTECVLDVDGEFHEMTTDGDGLIEHEVSPSAEKGKLTIQGMAFELLIGHLDPLAEATGQRARLSNLGYYAGDLEEPEEKLTQFAIELFQCDEKLALDGEITPDFLSKLNEIYGC